jgi:hypothetical protein
MYVQIIETIIAFYKKRLRRMFLAPNMSTSLQTTLAAYVHPAEGQFLHEEDIEHCRVSDIPSRN